MNAFNLKLPEEGLVFVAGRPGIGKTYVLIEIANELNRNGIKSILVYADVITSHDIIRYKNGKVHTCPSRLSCVKKVYPDIPYVVEDGANSYTSYGWKLFLTDIIEHEHPKAIILNSIFNTHEKATSEFTSSLQSIAKENHILILAENNISRSVEARKDKHPKPKDAKCTWKARKYVDQFVFVYRNIDYSLDVTERDERIEVYSLHNGITTLPFKPQKLYNTSHD